MPWGLGGIACTTRKGVKNSCFSLFLTLLDLFLSGFWGFRRLPVRGGPKTTPKRGQKQLFSRLNRPKTACFGVLSGYMGVYGPFRGFSNVYDPVFDGFFKDSSMSMPWNMSKTACFGYFWGYMGVYGPFRGFSVVFEWFSTLFSMVSLRIPP